MEILKIYKHILKEEQAESCIKAFGHKLFNDALGDGHEPDTSIENKIEGMIEKFTTSGHGKNLMGSNPTFIAAINKLKSCMDTYPEVLMPNVGISVYRGLKYPLDQMLNLYKAVGGRTTFKYPYRAKSYIQS